jgi:Kef-type K+ transport system membrane component KefB
MNFEFDYLALFIVFAIAWLIPVLASQLRGVKLPSVVLEIIAGILIGPYVLDIMPKEEYMHFLGLTGFIFLMFLSGLEIDVHQIVASFPRRKITVARFLKNPLLVGLTFFAGTLLFAVGGARLLGNVIDIENYWFFALIISTSSVGVIVPVLKERGEISTRFGQMIIMAAAVADILSILLFTFTASAMKHGLEWKVFLILLVFVLFFVGYQLGKRLIRFNYFNQVLFRLAHASSQIKVRGALLLIMSFLLLSQIIEAEVILGAFLAGLLLSFFLPKDRSILTIKLDGMGYGFFIPIFFIMVGASLDLGALRDFNKGVPFLLSLLVILYLVKIAPAYVWAGLFGQRKALAGGVLMSSRLSLIIAAAQIGLQLGVINTEVNAGIIIVAIITCIVSPIIYNQTNPTETYRKDKTIIVGGGSVGVLLARRLIIHEHPVVIIENDERRFREIEGKGIDVIFGDGLDRSIYEEVNLKGPNFVVVMTGDEKRNLEVCRLLRSEFQHERVVSRAASKEVAIAMENINAEPLDNIRIVATAIENIIFRPATYHTLFESFEAYTVQDFTITNRKMDSVQIRDVEFHEKGSIMLIRRNDEMHIPHGNTYFRIGDVVTVFGNGAALEDFRTKFE